MPPLRQGGRAEDGVTPEDATFIMFLSSLASRYRGLGLTVCNGKRHHYDLMAKLACSLTIAMIGLITVEINGLPICVHDRIMPV